MSSKEDMPRSAPRTSLTFMHMALDDLRDALDAADSNGSVELKREIMATITQLKAVIDRFNG